MLEDNRITELQIYGVGGREASDYEAMTLEQKAGYCEVAPYDLRFLDAHDATLLAIWEDFVACDYNVADEFQCIDDMYRECAPGLYEHLCSYEAIEGCDYVFSWEVRYKALLDERNKQIRIDRFVSDTRRWSVPPLEQLGMED